MLIGNFNFLAFRQDKGALWENFLISERMKVLSYQNSMAKPYFWRTTQQQEVDYVETVADEVNAYEFKWKAKKVKLSKTFSDNYKGSFTVVTTDNFREFLK